MHPNEDTSLSVEQKWIVGDTFLRNFYTIFDWKNKSIALLQPKGSDMKSIEGTPKQSTEEPKDEEEENASSEE